MHKNQIPMLKISFVEYKLNIKIIEKTIISVTMQHNVNLKAYVP